MGPYGGNVLAGIALAVRAFGAARMCGLAAIAAMATAVVSPGAKAEELVMPYACSVEAGQVLLTPSAPLSYPVAGQREEVPFTECEGRGPQSACTTLTVHRFELSCGGVKVTWAQVAAAARSAGVSLPSGLPKGFAPVGALNARLVFPALARFSSHKDRVVSETLSADSVIEPASPADRRPRKSAKPQPWQTVVAAEMRAETPGTALRLAGVAGGLLALVFAFGLVAARRNVAHAWAHQADAFSSSLPQRVSEAVLRMVRAISGSMADRFRRKPKMVTSERDRTALLNALAMAIARLAEAELQVGSLPRTLLLREVMQSELDQLRGRVNDIERAIDQRPMQKSAAMVRGILRELDRVSRIAQGAAQDTSAARDEQPEPQTAANAAGSQFQARGGMRMPQSVQEAYQMLGINDDAAPNVAKKLVDALRMSWHPDFARDEADRQVRESRMKQINAAWDLIRTRREAA